MMGIVDEKPGFAQPDIQGLVEDETLLGTRRDQHDMVRMGKKQELRRGFRFFSLTGYAMILGCSWEFAVM